jgi:UDPglucose 6-dehydrogenase
MKVSVIGTGYVGLVTGVCLAEVGNNVTCLDIDEEKINMLQHGKSPIYESGIEEMMEKNLDENRLTFTTNYSTACENADVIILAVGTPSNPNGSANLLYLQKAAETIGTHLKKDGTIIVTKSTVPVGTNNKVKQWVQQSLTEPIFFEVASNPEFLREGSAIQDTFEADRIVIGTESRYGTHVLEELYCPFQIPTLQTSLESAEMIKYASNAFLATKISFINEIANLCEKLGADIEDVAKGMGMDQRIGPHFLKAGIGYGGSCFPKDTNALVQIAGDIEHRFELLESVIRVNSSQQIKLIGKALDHFGSLKGKKAAILGLAFKPNTDDIRESAAIEMIKTLLHYGASVNAYDPVAIPNMKKLYPEDAEIQYASTAYEAMAEADMIFILTDWEEIKTLNLQTIAELEKKPVLFDGRNCFDLPTIQKSSITYHSIGRQIPTGARHDPKFVEFGDGLENQ